MRVQALLQKIFIKSRSVLDKRLYRLVLEVSETLSIHKKLSIFGLGRALGRSAKVKHNIKTVDRLFGNHALTAQRVSFYQDCASHIIGNTTRPRVIVDWSGLTPCGAFHFLRASVPVGGRALPLLDMAFALKDYQTRKSHRLFIDTLKMILPPDSRPIVITDAGFRCPWFQLIKSVGWDFVGRARNNTQYQDIEIRKWLPIKTLYARATTKANFLFNTMIAKANPVSCQFFLIKDMKKIA
jgi:Transposase DDE domain